MALDTRNKRASALLLAVLPLADGSIELADRQQVAWMYAGIEAGEEEVEAHSCGMVRLLPTYNARIRILANHNASLSLLPAYNARVEIAQC